MGRAVRTVGRRAREQRPVRRGMSSRRACAARVGLVLRARGAPTVGHSAVVRDGVCRPLMEGEYGAPEDGKQPACAPGAGTVERAMPTRPNPCAEHERCTATSPTDGPTPGSVGRGRGRPAGVERAVRLMRATRPFRPLAQAPAVTGLARGRRRELTAGRLSRGRSGRARPCLRHRARRRCRQGPGAW